MADTPDLQHAADLAEKYGDTKTQDNVKKMQYPYATGYWGKDWAGITDSSLYPRDARVQRYITQDRAMRNQKAAAAKKIDGSFKKGGQVKKTGIYKLHKGEKVTPAGKRTR